MQYLIPDEYWKLSEIYSLHIIYSGYMVAHLVETLGYMVAGSITDGAIGNFH
jgi:hypothetical protein